MKKLFMVPLVLIASLGLVSGVAMAQDASIENTGPGSTNEITIANENNLTCTNDTDIDVSVGGGTNDDQQSGQSAGSGNANSNGNTTGGDASSGDASNQNDVDLDVAVDNGACGGCTSCGGDGPGDTPVVATEDPAQPGVGGGDVIPETSPVTVLPNTAGETPLHVALIGATALSGVTLVARGGLALVAARLKS